MRFAKLLAIAAAAVGLLGFSQVQAKERWKIHSSVARNVAIIGMPPHRIAEEIEKLSGGELELKIYDPGALVPGNQYYDAVAQGSIDGAWGTPGFNVGKNPSYAFFSAVPFGPSAGEYLAWMYHGGGLEMATELYAKDNIKFLLCGVIAPESSGWFRKEITSLDDLKGLKMRFFGLGAKVMEKLGVSTQLLAGGDIYPALELGTIDATEFSMPAMDKDYGFYQVAKHNYYPGWHQASTLNELIFNMDKWNALSDAHKMMLEVTCQANITRQFAESEAVQFPAMTFFQEHGVTLHHWSDEMIAAFRKAWNEVIAEEVAKNETSKKIWGSFSKFRADYAIWKDNGYLK